ncbi:hypothetical protein GCK72_004477 [Caenorhabditis remanei]|uniref:Uncharacterized protein n=1 Tax=Caenorhabditis remanei TaxID=31234 RepID=A0A6A5HBY2_CAERE|nr:hypothetical protein GCK72_004477 [Caenorhabditis remanei]KAF1764529.1 hypothetical protein GCK72_004477 [Caenorhabditis remanei]
MLESERDASNLSDLILYSRNSFLYRGNALFQIATCVLTVLFSVKAFQLLYRRSVFHKSTRQLLFMSILYADFHAMSYGFLQGWSLYRSIVYSTDIDHIIYTGEECYPVTWTVGAAKMSMIFIQFALTVERIIDRVCSSVSSSKQFKYQGIVLNVVALVAALAMNLYSYSEGPTTTYKLQSCFMQKDIPLVRVMYALIVYLALSFICLMVNGFIIVGLHRNKKKSFNLKVRFNIQEVKNSSFAVCIISAIQSVAMFIYVVSNYGLFYFRNEISIQYFHNIVLCVYAIPYAGLCLPISIILCVRWISEHRKIKIVEMTKTNRNETMDNRILQLRNSWDAMAPPPKY